LTGPDPDRAAAGVAVGGPTPDMKVAAALAKAVAAVEGTVGGVPAAAGGGVGGPGGGGSSSSSDSAAKPAGITTCQLSPMLAIDVPGHEQAEAALAAPEGESRHQESSVDMDGNGSDHFKASFQQWIASPKDLKLYKLSPGVEMHEAAAAAAAGHLPGMRPNGPSAGGNGREKCNSDGLSDCLGSMMGSWSSQGSHHGSLWSSLAEGSSSSRVGVQPWISPCQQQQEQQQLEQLRMGRQHQGVCGGCAGPCPWHGSVHPSGCMEDSKAGIHLQHQGTAGFRTRRASPSDLGTLLEVSSRLEMPSTTMGNSLVPDAVQPSGVTVTHWKENAVGHVELNRAGATMGPQPIAEGTEWDSSCKRGGLPGEMAAAEPAGVGGDEVAENVGSPAETVAVRHETLVQGNQLLHQHQECKSRQLSQAAGVAVSTGTTPKGVLVEVAHSAPLPGVKVGPSTSAWTTGPSPGHPLENNSSSSRTLMNSSRSTSGTAARRKSSTSDPGRVDQVMQAHLMMDGSACRLPRDSVPVERRASDSSKGGGVLRMGRARRLSWLSTGTRNQDPSLLSLQAGLHSRAQQPTAAGAAAEGASYFRRKSATLGMSRGQPEGTSAYWYGGGSVRGGSVYRGISQTGSSPSATSVFAAKFNPVAGPSPPAKGSAGTSGGKQKKGQELLSELGQQVGLAGGLHGKKQQRRRRMSASTHAGDACAMLPGMGVDHEWKTTSCLFAKPVHTGAGTTTTATPVGSACQSPRAPGPGSAYCHGTIWGSSGRLSKMAVGGGGEDGPARLVAELQLVPMAGLASGPLSGRLGSGQTDTGLSILDGSGNLGRASLRGGEMVSGRGLLRVGSAAGLPSVSVASLAVGVRGSGAPTVAALPDQEIMHSLRMGGFGRTRSGLGTESTPTATAIGFEGPSIGQTCNALMAGSWLWARQLLVHDLGTFK
jgi:hypothetical protein